MRLVGLPNSWNPDEGLIPLDLQDIDIHATRDELRVLANFFAAASQLANDAENSISFGDSKPNAQTGIWFNVHVNGNAP